MAPDVSRSNLKLVASVTWPERNLTALMSEELTLPLLLPSPIKKPIDMVPITMPLLLLITVLLTRHFAKHRQACPQFFVQTWYRAE